MNIKKLMCLILLVTIASNCKKNNLLSKGASCDTEIYKLCDGKGKAGYCTLGYKWGVDNPYKNAGLEKPGPGTGNVTLTYAFMDEGYNFFTHSQDDLKSVSFEKNTLDCTQDNFRAAFKRWAAVAPLTFNEVKSSQNPDIKIIIADISQTAVGYPNFTNEPCKSLRGQIVIKKNGLFNCLEAEGIILHEIGHVLGLGHVDSENIMHPTNSYFTRTLRIGDINGIRSIYGAQE